MAFEFEKYLKTGSGIAFRNKHLLPSIGTSLGSPDEEKKGSEDKSSFAKASEDK